MGKKAKLMPKRFASETERNAFVDGMFAKLLEDELTYGETYLVTEEERAFFTAFAQALSDEGMVEEISLDRKSEALLNVCVKKRNQIGRIQLRGGERRMQVMQSVNSMPIWYEGIPFEQCITLLRVWILYMKSLEEDQIRIEKLIQGRRK